MRNFYLGIVAIFIMLWSTSLAYAAPINIINTKLSSSDGKTRIVFDLAAEPQYDVFTLSNPNRLVIDFEDAILQKSLSDLAITNTPILAVRDGLRPNNTLRIVFVTQQLLQPHAFILKSANGAVKLVIDLASSARADTTNDRQTDHASTHAVTDSTPQAVLTEHDLMQKKRDVVVVIDPGHGGKDPGASGPNGVHEKDVVFAISEALVKALNQQKGVKAILTRQGDYYIGLRQRLDIARKDKADLFIAIHADAYDNNFATGASVFALSEHGATSEAARWLAERENYSELGGVDEFSDKSYMVRSVLLDLSQTATITQSLQIGSMMLKTLQEVTSLHHDIVEQAGFMVLKSPDIPSLLIETGFISNPSEEERLSDPHYQQKLASAVTKGVVEFFQEHPPQGSIFSTKG